ncbi:Hsp20/alpha crystallin family protein [Terriglobus albidus]|uniref:Hsp20/alpha crystallin family protein n=1 Tax=Terriglobus albidus TaxID=1592106 RepID=A0A5B9EHG6_9BACT|nr:Hsp20/alpha crystallin family protein [Terriglobus albidus]QEE31054.1 Hsp20/alpha crystallin family protein [Terriglobus albidus]
MTITRWTPFSELAVLQNRLNSIFNDFGTPEGRSESLASGNFTPAVDVYEDAQKIVLKLDVPGIRQEDIDVRLENQTLTVKGERKFEKEEKEENFHRIERRYGSFIRVFTLPPTADMERVSADYKDGVLQVEIAKKSEAQPKQIKVGAGAGPKQVEAKTAA